MLTCRGFDDFEVVGYIDFDFVGCIDKHKTVLEVDYVFIVVGGAASWKLKKSSLASSTMHARFMACHDTTSGALQA